MRGQAGFWDIDERYARLSEAGDPLEKLNALVPWEIFRKPLAKALKRSDGAKGGRPPYDPVMMFKIMVLQALYGLSDDQAEFQIQDRLSFMRFLGLGLSDGVPDAKTIWLFREHLTQAGAVENLFARFDKHLSKAGYLAMGGQIVDATIVAAPKQRNTDAEKADIKAGKVPDEWKNKPAKLRQKDRDARWTVKFSKARVAEEGKAKLRDIAIPTFGYKNHASIDRRHGFIRGWNVTGASAYDGAQLRNRSMPAMFAIATRSGRVSMKQSSIAKFGMPFRRASPVRRRRSDRAPEWAARVCWQVLSSMRPGIACRRPMRSRTVGATATTSPTG